MQQSWAPVASAFGKVPEDAGGHNIYVEFGGRINRQLLYPSGVERGRLEVVERGWICAGFRR